MEAVRTSETSVDNHFTRQYIPEDNSEQMHILWKLKHYPRQQATKTCRLEMLTVRTIRPLHSSDPLPLSFDGRGTAFILTTVYGRRA